MSGNRRPVMRDVAELAQVSQATVSYVLSGRAGGKSRITTETRERILAAAHELNYVPNFAARGLRRGSTDQICLVSRWASTMWARAIVAEMNGRGDPLGLVTVQISGGDWLGYLQRLAAGGAIVDLAGSDARHRDDLARLAELGVTLTVASGSIDPQGFDVVRSDEADACRQAMRALLAAGHTRIGCLRQFLADDTGGYVNLRLDAYQSALAEAGIAPDPELIRSCEGSWPRAYSEALDLLARPDRPTAVLSLNDQGCHAALWAADRLGLSVPDDLAVVGVGMGLRDATALDGRSISRVVPENDNAAAEVVDLLFSRLDDPSRSDRLVIQRWRYEPGQTS